MRIDAAGDREEIHARRSATDVLGHHHHHVLTPQRKEELRGGGGPGHPEDVRHGREIGGEPAVDGESHGRLADPGRVDDPWFALLDVEGERRHEVVGERRRVGHLARHADSLGRDQRTDHDQLQQLVAGVAGIDEVLLQGSLRERPFQRFTHLLGRAANLHQVGVRHCSEAGREVSELDLYRGKVGLAGECVNRQRRQHECKARGRCTEPGAAVHDSPAPHRAPAMRNRATNRSASPRCCSNKTSGSRPTRPSTITGSSSCKRRRPANSGISANGPIRSHHASNP